MSGNAYSDVHEAASYAMAMRAVSSLLNLTLS
jgi:hypothetical protein